MAYVFYKFHVCFDLSVLKNQTHSTYVWRRKVVKAQREDYVVIQWQFYIFKTGGATFENVNSRHNWGASQWSTQASRRIATVVTRLPCL